MFICIAYTSHPLPPNEEYVKKILKNTKTYSILLDFLVGGGGYNRIGNPYQNSRRFNNYSILFTDKIKAN